mmetsp:Transcript_48208/g.140461  ORF Transcript_48208/g.140461 Transcript_48208/m.140461 type:complete len:95 (+) Transcript_48208:570-854(+)
MASPTTSMTPTSVGTSQSAEETDSEGTPHAAAGTDIATLRAMEPDAEVSVKQTYILETRRAFINPEIPNTTASSRRRAASAPPTVGCGGRAPVR